MTDQEIATLRLELKLERILGRSMVGKLKPIPDLAATIAPVARRSQRNTKAEREMAEYERRIDAAGPNANVEKILSALKYELGYESGLNLMGIR